jgi:hypothetical protein
MKSAITNFNSIKKEKFIDFYKRDEVRGNVTTSCDAVGINRTTYYNWLEKDEDFRKQIYDAKMAMCDDMEQVLIARAVEKDTTALIYWLKYNHPQYKEVGNTTNIQVNVIPILGGVTKDVQTSNSNQETSTT